MHVVVNNVQDMVYHNFCRCNVSGQKCLGISAACQRPVDAYIKFISPIIIIVSTLHVANFDPSPAMRKLHANRFVHRGKRREESGLGDSWAV